MPITLARTCFSASWSFTARCGSLTMSVTSVSSRERQACGRGTRTGLFAAAPGLTFRIVLEATTMSSCSASEKRSRFSDARFFKCVHSADTARSTCSFDIRHFPRCAPLGLETLELFTPLAARGSLDVVECADAPDGLVDVEAPVLAAPAVGTASFLDFLFFFESFAGALGSPLGLADAPAALRAVAGFAVDAGAAALVPGALLGASGDFRFRIFLLTSCSTGSVVLGAAACNELAAFAFLPTLASAVFALAAAAGTGATATGILGFFGLAVLA
mmetsp:Transcript_1871/g.3953  ORF Transcript_1871/g.3953 Transcript_1871/m.3953 type:complete len:274 (-) Transcript_1871:307-1128(-)